MSAKDGSRTGGGGPVRPRLANPYDLGTWSAAGAPTEETGPTGVRPRVDRGVGGLYDDPGRREAPLVADEVLFDPPELPAASDPFELARRTVNRSRAAARDRGLFPISAKTQARDVRDRSGRAPGYSGSRPDPRDPQGIENVLKKVLGNLGWNAGMSAGRVLEEWDDIVGERLAIHCRPVSFEEGVLVVSASSSAWAAQLRMLTPQLITTIEERVGSHVISELTVTGPAAAQRSWKKGRRTVTWRGPRDTYG
ncbi:MAG: DciA family protein [Brachybacterium sp.]|nr:DciA family protein [Brachybacterium sp.]